MDQNNKNIYESFIELIKILKILRSPNGCEWDKKQTSESLIPYLLEETYEVIEAIEDKNPDALKEELGDLILHILFQAEIAQESNDFDISDSLKYISNKLIKRHPNVFPEKNNSKNINQSWEQLKQKENKRKSILDGVPKNMSALIRARRIQEKAASVGFDWHQISPVIDKVDEEILELKEAITLSKIENIKNEMGDVFFSLVNLCRFLDLNPEETLRMTITKFTKRFNMVDDELKKRGKTFQNSNLEEMDEIWNLIKKKACK